jgi:hypothetical protein
MMDAAKIHEEESKMASEIKAKTGKNVLFGRDYKSWADASADDEMFNRGYQRSAAAELDVTEDMKKVVDQVKPEAWEKIGLTGEKLTKFRSDFKSDPRAAIDGYLKTLNVAGNKEQLQKLRDELHNVFKGTESYKQQRSYEASTEEELAKRFDDFIELSKFESEEAKYYKDERLDQELKRRQLMAEPPVAPFVPNNLSALVDVSPETWQKQEEQVRLLKIQRDNLIAENPQSEELGAMNDKISQLEESLGASRTVVEKEHFKWDQEFTKYQNLLGKGAKLEQREGVAGGFKNFPKTEEEFADAVRSGTLASMVAGQYTPAGRHLNSLVERYKNRLETSHESLKAAKNYTVFAEAGNPAIEMQNKQWTELFTANTGFTDPVTKEQVTPESITKKMGEIDIDGVVYVHDPAKDRVQVTSGNIGGKPIMHLIPGIKPKDGSEGGARTYGQSFTITPDDQKQAAMSLEYLADTMTNPANTNDRQRLRGQARFAPQIAAADLEFASSPRTVGQIGGNDIIIEPIGKDEKGKRNTKFRIKTEGEVLGEVSGLSDVYRALGLLVENAQAKATK